MIFDILKLIRDVKPDLISYKLCDVEDGAYYGKMDKDGNWLIMKEETFGSRRKRGFLILALVSFIIKT